MREIRTKSYTPSDVNKYIKIAEINLLRFDGKTKYFGSQALFRICLARAGIFVTKSYLVNFQLISNNLDYTIAITENNDNKNIINLYAIKNDDVVTLYLKASPYSYNEGFVIQTLFENRNGFIDFKPYNDYVDIDVSNALTVLDYTVSFPEEVTVTAENGSDISRLFATKMHGYLDITANVTVNVETGNIFSINILFPNTTQYFMAYNRTQKDIVVLVAYANTKAITLSSIAGSVVSGDVLLINTRLKIKN